MNIINKIPENVIVTVFWNEIGWEHDMRFPTLQPYGQWKDQMFFLVSRETGRKIIKNSLALSLNGKIIKDQQTLEDLSVWDGSCLYLERS